MDFKINRKYNYNTIAPNILGSSYSNMTLIGIMSFSEASKEYDILSIHSSIRNQTANINVPVNASDCTYLKFKSPGGDFKIIAQEYITSSEEVESTTLTITVKNYTSSDYIVLKNALEGLGYFDLDFNIT